MTIYAGSMARLRVTFVDAAGLPVAVTGVSMRYRHNQGAPVDVPSGSIVEESAGVYRADIGPVQFGAYYVQAACTGPAACVVETAFPVKASTL